MTSRSSEPSSPERAYQYALRLLNARDYSLTRMREKLIGRGFGEADAEAALARLMSEGWLNDLRFAERFAESALASGRYVGVRLRQEMRRRGLAAEVVTEVLGRLTEGHDEAGEARLLLERRFPGFSYAAAGDREKRRAAGFLQRRGFSLSAVMSALKNSGRQ